MTAPLDGRTRRRMEAYLAGKAAYLEGSPRQPPEDYSGEERARWIRGWDAQQADAVLHRAE